ncbi:MAG: hypothetical protein QME78_16805, partial [Thermodesulfobacteriota bacterium]|nr:hypothetical protein [Thermodesulfobacteriota bacterium]
AGFATNWILQALPGALRTPFRVNLTRQNKLSEEYFHVCLKKSTNFKLAIPPVYSPLRVQGDEIALGGAASAGEKLFSNG